MLRGLHKLLAGCLRAERRIDPFIRPTLDLLQRPGTWLVQLLMNAGRPNLRLAIAEERILPDEEALTRR